MPTDPGGFGGGMATYAPKKKKNSYGGITGSFPAAGVNLSPTYGAPGKQTSAIGQWATQNIPGWSNNQTTTQMAQNLKKLYDTGYQASQNPQLPLYGGSGGGWGGGGGGGGGGPAGLDQATLDWLLGQIGRGRPQDLRTTQLDLPDPGQFLGAFNTQPYDVARQGIKTGLEAIMQRGNQAFGNARGELNRYSNPYANAFMARNPAPTADMRAMAAANEALPALGEVTNEGIQADRAMQNTMAMLQGADQSRQAANLRALAGDQRMMETNMGLEGNMLNLMTNMAQAKGSSAWDQMVRQAQLEAAQQEAAQNWQRGNQVGDTNVTNRNQWNQGLLQTLLSIVGSKAPGTTLPVDVGGFYV